MLWPFVLSDLPFLEGLFDILPLVCDDNQARSALWCILARLLAQAQGIDMNSSSLEHFVSLLLGKFILIKDDLESHRVEKEVELSAEDTYFMHGVSTSVSFPVKYFASFFSPGKHSDLMEMLDIYFLLQNLTHQT